MKTPEELEKEQEEKFNELYIEHINQLQEAGFIYDSQSSDNHIEACLYANRKLNKEAV